MECFRILQNLDNGKLPLNRVMTKQIWQSLKIYTMHSLVPLARKGLNSRGREQILQRRGFYWLSSASEFEHFRYSQYTKLLLLCTAWTMLDFALAHLTVLQFPSTLGFCPRIKTKPNTCQTHTVVTVVHNENTPLKIY